jgi:hypothetical protein
MRLVSTRKPQTKPQQKTKPKRRGHVLSPDEVIARDECIREFQVFLRAGPCGAHRLTAVHGSIMRHYGVAPGLFKHVMACARATLPPDEPTDC